MLLVQAAQVGRRELCHQGAGTIDDGHGTGRVRRYKHNQTVINDCDEEGQRRKGMHDERTGREFLQGEHQRLPLGSGHDRMRRAESQRVQTALCTGTHRFNDFGGDLHVKSTQVLGTNPSENARTWAGGAPDKAR